MSVFTLATATTVGIVLGLLFNHYKKKEECELCIENNINEYEFECKYFEAGEWM